MSLFEHVKVGTGPLRERNKQRTYDRIVQAATELFRSRGFDGTTMEDIASHAEVSRATLFNYFGTKDALLLPFIETAFNELILPAFTSYLALEPDPFDALRFLVMGVHEYMLAVPEVELAMRRELLRPEHWTRAPNPDTSGFVRALHDLIRYGQRRGAFRRDIATDVQAGFLGSLVGGMFLNFVAGAPPASFPEAIETLLRFVRSGLQPT